MFFERLAAEAKGLRITVEATTAAPKFVYADAVRCRQIVCNLISNAINFSPPGGVVRLILDGTADTFLLTVADQGPGVPTAARERIFAPYDQGGPHTARSFGGTGLGLALSLQLARAMGGDVNLAPADSVGARFTLSLPTMPAGKHSLPVEGELKTAPLAGIRTLVVDDDEPMRALTTALLRQAGATVAETADAAQAADAAATGEYDVCVLDMHLPGVDGATLAGQLKASGLGARLLAFYGER